MFDTLALKERLTKPVAGDWRVLATIIATEGSTYRGPGAKLLIESTGDMTGVISGGCFDSALFEYALSCHDSGAAQTVTFDLRDEDDAIFGMGLGCQGMIQLLLEPISAAKLCDEDGDLLIGNPFGDVAETIALSWSEGSKVERQPVAKHTKTDLSGAQKIFVEHREPRPRLNLIGCGPDAIPVVRFAQELGWRLRLVDHRDQHLNRSDFPDHAERFLLRPEAFFKEQSFGPKDAVLAMSHNFMIDVEAVKAATKHELRYVGVLGPRKRGLLVREQVIEEATPNEAFWQRFYNPVGLDIGSENAEEIALSAITEINAIMFNRRQCHLRDKETKV